MGKMFQGKKFLVLGVANKKSIAWGISEALHQQGAELALTFMNEAIEKRVRPLAAELGDALALPCDVQSDEEISNLFAELEGRWGKIDGIVHSVAYAEREDLQNPFSQTTRTGFQTALDISAYSLVALCGRAKPLFSEEASVISMSYLGSERAVENYNVMGVAKAALESSTRYLAAELGESGVRVNAISAGPIKTLAASGIPKFKELLAHFAEKAPLRRNVDTGDVARTALYLLSPLSSGVTGEVLYVDGGYSRVGA
ncbi:enoyl-ACP reductase [bacterium]|nr:enoyl-ACP reductase [bacterium]